MPTLGQTGVLDLVIAVGAEMPELAVQGTLRERRGGRVVATAEFLPPEMLETQLIRPNLKNRSTLSQ
jgi:hypothetical protein